MHQYTFSWPSNYGKFSKNKKTWQITFVRVWLTPGVEVQPFHAQGRGWEGDVVMDVEIFCFVIVY